MSGCTQSEDRLKEKTQKFLRFYNPDPAKQQKLLGWFDDECCQEPNEISEKAVTAIATNARSKSPKPITKISPTRVASGPVIPEIVEEEHLDSVLKCFTMKYLVQATLPHNKPTGSIYTRTNGNFKLKIVADDVGLPYGTYARLILIWIISEAVRTKSPMVHLGKLSDFLKKLEIKSTGGKTGSIGYVKDQMRRLFSSTLMVRYEDEEREEGKNLTIASEYLLWNHDQRESTVILDAKFFAELIAHPIPIDFRAIQRLRQSSLALDVYCWLSHRLSYVHKETMVTWDQFAKQIGAEYKNIRHLRAKFKAALDKMSDLFPETRVRPNVRGVLLLPPKTKKIPHVGNAGAPKVPDILVSDPCGPDGQVPGAGGWRFELDEKTREAARRIAPHLDIDYLLQEWKEWINKTGKVPLNPIKAFIGFVRKKAKQLPPAY